MTALTENFNRLHSELSFRQAWPVAAATTIYKGAMVAFSGGYLVNATNAAGTYAIGVAEDGADNASGANGDVSVGVHFNCIVEMKTSGSVTQANIGNTAYIVDNNTVTATAGDAIAGIFHIIDEYGRVFVWINPKITNKTAMEDFVIQTPVTSLRQADLAPIGITTTVGDHYLSLSTNAILVNSEVATSNTKTDVSYLVVHVPENLSKVSPTTAMKINVSHIVTGGGTGTSTIDFSAYKQNDGAVGADLVTTSAISTTTSWADSSFVIDTTTLTGGDTLIVKMTTETTETAAGNLQAQIENIFITYRVA